MPITTLDKVKPFLDISESDTTKDEKLSLLIELVEDWMKGYTNDSFTDADDNPVYPAGYELIALKMIAYNLDQNGNKASESLGNYSASFLTDYPKDITRGLKRKVKWS